MKFRLSKSLGVDVSRIGLGCVTFGREIDEAASFHVMDTALGEGINLFDTAEAYGQGTSEKIVGSWLSANRCRDRIILQSKVRPPFTRRAVLEAFEKSCERLKTDRLELYLLHQYDPATDLRETMEALTELSESKRVDVIGCSNFSLTQLQEAHAISHRHGLSTFGAIQPVYNLLAREIENGMLQYCSEHAIDVISYSPLAAGFLTGKYLAPDNAAPKGSRFDLAPGHKDLYFSDRNFTMLQDLRTLAAAHHLQLHELALLWALQNSSILCVLAGATRIEHLGNALKALNRPLEPPLMEMLQQL